ncbi:MAG: HD domain-containing protein [Bacteroidota bacterium]
MENTLIKKVKAHVITLLSEQLSTDITYHSINHTQDVVRASNEIAEKQKFSEEEIEILNIAAWFHDVGYIKGSQNHEDRSAVIAGEYLEKRNYPEEKIKQVKGCILATKMPQKPKNALQKTICDADLMHLASEDYFKKADLLHNEIEKTKLCKIPENEWLKMNQEFLTGHCFFTEYAQKTYYSAVQENLRKVRERLKPWQKTKK